MVMEEITIFEDAMYPGIKLSNAIDMSGYIKYYPDYLQIDRIMTLTINDKLNPSVLPPKCVFIYETNLYITDENGNIAYIDCDMKHINNASRIKSQHREYKSVGGKRVIHPDMDAGHFGVSLNQHPSIAMEHHKYTNRYGMWRKMELEWDKLSREGHKVNVKAVFVEEEGEDTYSSFWCIRETIDEEEINEYIVTNDDAQ